MVKLGKTYFMFTSMMTGWDANENQYTTSTNLRSGWSAWKKFADSGSKVSCAASTVRGTNYAEAALQPKKDY
jgi:hypothetical protein